MNSLRATCFGFAYNTSLAFVHLLRPLKKQMSMRLKKSIEIELTIDTVCVHSCLWAWAQLGVEMYCIYRYTHA